VYIRLTLRTTLYLLCICANLSLYAQYSENSLIHYQVNDGLPSSTCYDLAQDSKGFLWIATEGGLTKYDGYQFKTFTTSDGLLDNEIVKLQIDQYDRVWMNTNDQISYMCNDSVHIIPSELNTSLKWRFKLFEDNHDMLWISRFDNLNVYDSESLEPIDIELPKEVKGEAFVIAGEYNDLTWIVHNDIIYQYEKTTLKDSFKLLRSKDIHLLNKTFFHISSADLYYMHDDVLCKINLDTRSSTELVKIDSPIRQLTIKDGHIWVLTQTSLSKYDLGEKFQTSAQEKMLMGEHCSRFLFDNDENLWTAMYKNGLMMMPPENELIEATTFHKLGSNKLESVFIDDQHLMVGSEVGDIYIHRYGTWKRYASPSQNNYKVERIVDIIAIDDEGYLISKDSGLYLFRDEKTKKLIDTNCKNIFYKNGSILLNAYNKTFEITKEDLLSIEEPISGEIANDLLRIVEEGRAYSSTIDRNNRIWNTNVISGLSVSSEMDTFFYKSLSNIFNCTISRIKELDSGVICAVTKGEGLILVKDKQFRQINVSNGLSSNFCYDFDVAGNKLFIGTNKGVSIVDLLDFDMLDFKIKIIDRNNGLLTNEVQDIKVHKDKLYLATNAGLLTYSLSDKVLESNEKEIYLEEFKVNDQKQSMQSEYSLKASENNIRIKYISPDIGSNQHPLYAYQLVGVDEDWITTSATETHYSNLESGMYEFQYKLALAKGAENVKKISIEIHPRFVESNMFKMVILMGLGMLFLLPLYLSHNSQKRNLLTTLLDKKSDEINSKVKLLEKSNKRLVASNKELEQFAYIASHDLQEPINTIKGFSDILAKKLEASNDESALKMLNIINDSSTRMKDLVKDLLIYSRIGKEKKKSMVDMNGLLSNIINDLNDRIESNNAKVEWDNLPYIPGYQVELRSLFQNLLSNAMKFQKPGVPPEIKISFKKIASGIEFSVKDNGIGIGQEHADRIFEIFQRLHNKDQYEGTGIGLAHCKKIVNLHNGRIWVESKVGEGCDFKFTIEV